MHAQDLGANDDLVLIDEAFGVGRPQELAHLDGPGLAIFLELPAKPRACEPSRGRRKRASRDTTEHRRQRRVELVGKNPPTHAEHVRDVFRSSAKEARSCESGVMQPGEGPIPSPRQGRGRVTVGVSSQGVSGEKLFGPGQILLLLEGEHRRDKSSDGLAVRADGGYSASSVSSRQGIAVDEELSLGTLEKGYVST